MPNKRNNNHYRSTGASPIGHSDHPANIVETQAQNRVAYAKRQLDDFLATEIWIWKTCNSLHKLRIQDKKQNFQFTQNGKINVNNILLF